MHSPVTKADLSLTWRRVTVARRRKGRRLAHSDRAAFLIPWCCSNEQKTKLRPKPGSTFELPDTIYVIQHCPDAGWNDVGIGDDREQSRPQKENNASSEQTFHGRILPILRPGRLPKLRIGGLH